MKCFQAKARQIEPQWYVIDASDKVVGRLAAQIAPILMGKHRPTYTPHIDTGDYVIVTNVEKVVFTGNKWQQKIYARYSGHPGGLKEEPAWKLAQRFPERILYEAVRRMMPKNKLGRHMLDKLKLYVGPQHPHQAQQPIPLDPYGGRPSASGAIFAPPPPPPRPKKKTVKAKPADETPEFEEESVTAAPVTATAEAPPTEPVAEAAPEAPEPSQEPTTETQPLTEETKADEPATDEPKPESERP